MTGQTGRKRTHHQLQRDRQLVADWYCQGLTQAAISDRINSGEHLAEGEPGYVLSQQTISADIQAVQKVWLKSSLRDFDKMRAEQLGKIDRLEREYWRGWEQSCKDVETTRQEGPMSGPEKVVKTSKEQAGNPTFLAGVRDCIDRRIKLLGLDAPTNIDIKSGGKSIIPTLAATLARVYGRDDDDKPETS